MTARTAPSPCTLSTASAAPRSFTPASWSIATGYYDLPNYLHIPGESLSKVHHYYFDPHPYFGMDVVVIGGKNSAAIAALELWRTARGSPWSIATPRCTSM